MFVGNDLVIIPDKPAALEMHWCWVVEYWQFIEAEWTLYCKQVTAILAEVLNIFHVFKFLIFGYAHHLIRFIKYC